jgi:hypothetical protein
MATYELFQAIDSSSVVPVSVRAKLCMTCSVANSIFKHRLNKEKRIQILKRSFFKNLNTSKNVRFRKVVRYALQENSDLNNIGEMLIVCGFPSFIHGYELPEGEYRDCWKSGTRIRSYAHPVDKFVTLDHALLQLYYALRHARVNNLPIPDPKVVLGEMESKSETDLYAMGW